MHHASSLSAEFETTLLPGCDGKVNALVERWFEAPTPLPLSFLETVEKCAGLKYSLAVHDALEKVGSGALKLGSVYDPTLYGALYFFLYIESRYCSIEQLSAPLRRAGHAKLIVAALEAPELIEDEPGGFVETLITSSTYSMADNEYDFVGVMQAFSTAFVAGKVTEDNMHKCIKAFGHKASVFGGEIGMRKFARVMASPMVLHALVPPMWEFVQKYLAGVFHPN